MDKMDDTDRTKTTVSYNGESADVGDRAATEALAGAFVRDSLEAQRPRNYERVGQTSMLARFPGMDEHAQLVQQTVREIAAQLPTGTEISLSVKIPVEFWSDDHTRMEGKFTFKMDAKPAKEKED